MVKQILIIACVFTLARCSTKHKTAEEIFDSGAVNNLNDFVRIDTGADDDDTLLDVYKYKYDTAFLVEIMYTYTLTTQKKTFRNYAFLYKGAYEGKVIFYNPDSSIAGTVFYRNGKKLPDSMSIK